MNIRQWLSGIVVFLLAPSLLFAGLWVKNSLNEVRALDAGLSALNAASGLESAIRARMLQDDPLSDLAPPEIRPALQMSEEEAVEYQLSLTVFRDAETVHGALRGARSAIRLLFQSAKISSVISPQASELAYLISDTLPTVIIESSAMVHGGLRLAEKPELNLWDKMAIPVQGGQFKVSADTVTRVTNMTIGMLPEAGTADLRMLSDNYRASNGIYQNAGSRLLMSTSAAQTGQDIEAGPVLDAWPELANATMDLWAGSVAYLTAELEERRSATSLGVVLAGTVGLLVIAAAFGLAIVLSRAVAERTQKEFDKLGYHDPLTGLPNRRGLMSALEVEAGTEPEGFPALMLLDIRRFKAINNRYGDEVGDSVLRSIAEDLAVFGDTDDFIVRTGGTEFAILRRNVTDQKSFHELGEKIVQHLARERNVDGFDISLESCIGYAIGTVRQQATEQLIMDATLALRSVKQRNTLSVCQFHPNMRAQFEKNTEIAKDLLEAMNSGHILAWFQPQICAKSDTVVGAEALVRWVDAENGVRYPGAFLPAAEEAGYMERVDRCVRKQALAMTARLRENCPIPFHVGLNLTASVLIDEDCVALLLEEVEAAGLKPDCVSIEILEAVMIDEFAATPIKANIAKLSELGFFIELDDFGTGHSSITSLRDLKVDRVKIDRSFVRGVDSDPELQKFTRALIQLARSLDISTLAEGVETEAERTWLADHGCDVIQGFL
ncbi:bifunctional diguanylate cyclase/phosphodiesterase, partial [Roseibium hamelinense]|uniref:EAL domain-containing protein n=1 Tax=Roseibium hamelinense TaxID=150831 RepID=UPI0012BCBEC1|nr:bifunctional diguanylate cyclase/phosphodiesterase [Roseibium hamelinense]